MKNATKRLWPALAVLMLAGTIGPVSAQPFGFGGDDGPPPFRRGPGWDGPHRGPWDRWHRGRHWRDEGVGRREGFGRREGWRDRDRFDGRARLGDDNRRRGPEDGPGGRGPGRGGRGFDRDNED